MRIAEAMNALSALTVPRSTHFAEGCPSCPAFFGSSERNDVMNAVTAIAPPRVGCVAGSPATAYSTASSFCERIDRRWADVGGELFGVAVRRSFDARIGARLTPAGAFRAGSEREASDRVH